MGANLILFLQPFAGCSIDHPDGPGFVFSKTDVNAMSRRIVAQIIDISMKIDFLDKLEAASVKNSQFSFAAGNEDFLGIRRIGYALRIWYIGNGARSEPCADIDNFNGIVA
jgi:hypothetical protein